MGEVPHKDEEEGGAVSWVRSGANCRGGIELGWVTYRLV